MLPFDAQQLSAFEEHGFVFLPSLFSDAEVAVLRAGAARALARHPESARIYLPEGLPPAPLPGAEFNRRPSGLAQGTALRAMRRDRASPPPAKSSSA